MHAGNALNIQHLQALEAVRQHGSISAAATALYLTPSAVSQQLQALATSCGFEIAERHGRSIRLTHAGLALAQLAREVLNRWERGLETLAAHTERPIRTLRMGALSSAYRTWLAPAVATIRATTGVDMELLEVNPDRVCEYLIDGIIDIGVSVHIQRELPPTIQRFPLYSDVFTLIGAVSQPHAKSDLLKMKDECWVLPESGTYCHEIIAAHCARIGFAPHAIARTNDWNVMQAMAASLNAVALVPQTCLIPVAGLSMYEIDGDLPEWPIELITRSDIAHISTFRPVHEVISRLAPTTAVML